MTKAPPPTIHVLLVDDDAVEVMALTRALRRASTPHTLTIAHDGLEALAYLRGEGRPPLGKPALVFMDLNMPRMNGHELLSALRSDPHHARTDVVVVTTSRAAEDQRAAWQNRVAGYIVKSNHGEAFEAFANEVEGFLLRSALTDGHISGPFDALVLSRPELEVPFRAALRELSHVVTCATTDAAIERMLHHSFDCLVVDVAALHESLASFASEATYRGVSLPALVSYAPRMELAERARGAEGWAPCASLAGDALHRAVVEAFARHRGDVFLKEHQSGIQIRRIPQLGREGTDRE